MTDKQDSQTSTYTQQQKSVLLFRVFIIVKLDGILIEENRLRFFKRNAVFLLVLPILVSLSVNSQRKETAHAVLCPLSRNPED